MYLMWLEYGLSSVPHGLIKLTSESVVFENQVLACCIQVSLFCPTCHVLLGKKHSLRDYTNHTHMHTMRMGVVLSNPIIILLLCCLLGKQGLMLA